jgi:hypothetical protein
VTGATAKNSRYPAIVRLWLINEPYPPAVFAAFLAGHTAGLLDFQLLFGAGAPTLPIRAQRQVIHSALGHTAARVHAYSSMPQAEAVFGPSAADLEEILRQLRQELGLPFENEYLAHIGNFEVFTLGEWGETPPPFLIETEPASPIDNVPRSPRALVIARTPVFATKTHFAHVVIRESDEVLEERLVTLPPGMGRSDPIEVTDVIDGFEFYLFTEEGALLHREVGNFIREAGGIIAFGGPTLRLDDRLSRRATGVSHSLAEAAAVVQARTSSRFRAAPESGPFSYRSFSARMRAFVRERSPPKSDDRFFKRSLPNEGRSPAPQHDPRRRYDSSSHSG